jgi:hypothetical protein
VKPAAPALSAAYTYRSESGPVRSAALGETVFAQAGLTPFMALRVRMAAHKSIASGWRGS